MEVNTPLNTFTWPYHSKQKTRSISWQYEQLKFGLLGGFRIEGLERMRETLKVEYKQLAVRYNLDPYKVSDNVSIILC
jgi:hypothetical protein